MRKENKVVLSYRWPFQDGRSKGMGTEWVHVEGGFTGVAVEMIM